MIAQTVWRDGSIWLLASDAQKLSFVDTQQVFDLVRRQYSKCDRQFGDFERRLSMIQAQCPSARTGPAMEIYALWLHAQLCSNAECGVVHHEGANAGNRPDRRLEQCVEFSKTPATVDLHSRQTLSNLVEYTRRNAPLMAKPFAVTSPSQCRAGHR